MQATSPLAEHEIDSASRHTSPFRIIKQRRSLPRARAVLGGALVAVAAVGTFAAAGGAGSDHGAAAVVATRDLPAGTRVQASDLSTVKLTLTPDLEARTFKSVAAVAGSTLVAPVSRGELVQSGATVAKDSAPSEREMSFSVPAARALSGALASGETIDVLTTDKGATTGAARTAVAGARILRVERAGGGGLSGGGDVVITVALRTSSEAAALASAVDSGSVTVVRTTGTDRATP